MKKAVYLQDYFAHVEFHHRGGRDWRSFKFTPGGVDFEPQLSLDIDSDGDKVTFTVKNDFGLYVCEFCGKQFSTKERLHDHQVQAKKEADKRKKALKAAEKAREEERVNSVTGKQAKALVRATIREEKAAKAAAVKEQAEKRKKAVEGLKGKAKEAAKQAFDEAEEKKDEEKEFFHPGPDEGDYKCPHCDRTFGSKKRLKTHQATHTRKYNLETLVFDSKTELPDEEWHFLLGDLQGFPRKKGDKRKSSRTNPFVYEHPKDKTYETPKADEKARVKGLIKRWLFTVFEDLTPHVKSQIKKSLQAEYLEDRKREAEEPLDRPVPQLPSEDIETKGMKPQEKIDFFTRELDKLTAEAQSPERDREIKKRQTQLREAEESLLTAEDRIDALKEKLRKIPSEKVDAVKRARLDLQEAKKRRLEEHPKRVTAEELHTSLKTFLEPKNVEQRNRLFARFRTASFRQSIEKQKLLWAESLRVSSLLKDDDEPGTERYETVVSEFQNWVRVYMMDKEAIDFEVYLAQQPFDSPDENEDIDSKSKMRYESAKRLYLEHINTLLLRCDFEKGENEVPKFVPSQVCKKLKAIEWVLSSSVFNPNNVQDKPSPKNFHSEYFNVLTSKFDRTWDTGLVETLRTLLKTKILKRKAKIGLAGLSEDAKKPFLWAEAMQEGDLALLDEYERKVESDAGGQSEDEGGDSEEGEGEESDQGESEEGDGEEGEGEEGEGEESESEGSESEESEGGGGDEAEGGGEGGDEGGGEGGGGDESESEAEEKKDEDELGSDSEIGTEQEERPVKEHKDARCQRCFGRTRLRKRCLKRASCRKGTRDYCWLHVPLK